MTQRSNILECLAELKREAGSMDCGNPHDFAVALGINRAIRAVKQVLGRDKSVLVLTPGELRRLRDVINSHYPSREENDGVWASLQEKVEPTE